MNSNSIAATQLFDCVWPVWPPCILKMSYEMDIHQPTQSSLMTNHVIVSIRAMGVEALRRCYNDAAVREKVSHGDDCIMVLSAFSHHHITPLCHLQDSLTGPDHFGCTCTPRPFSWTTTIIFPGQQWSYRVQLVNDYLPQIEINRMDWPMNSAFDLSTYGLKSDLQYLCWACCRPSTRHPPEGLHHLGQLHEEVSAEC